MTTTLIILMVLVLVATSFRRTVRVVRSVVGSH